jgi:nucleotide-binding universal stress UspA family protein
MTMNLPVLDPVASTRAASRPQPLHLESILVPLDLSDLSLASLRYAVPLARQFGARLTLLHVVEPPPPTAALPFTAPLEDRDPGAPGRQLDEIRALEVAPELDAKTVVRRGCVFDQILSVARAECADLIVTTTHGHTGLKHLLMGSTAECIVHGAPCAVLVVRERADEPAPRF